MRSVEGSSLSDRTNGLAQSNTQVSSRKAAKTKDLQRRMHPESNLSPCQPSARAVRSVQTRKSLFCVYGSFSEREIVFAVVPVTRQLQDGEEGGLIPTAPCAQTRSVTSTT